MNKTTIYFIKQAIKFLNLTLDEEAIRTKESEDIYKIILCLQEIIKVREKKLQRLKAV